jgi:hypothetical protein
VPTVAPTPISGTQATFDVAFNVLNYPSNTVSPTAAPVIADTISTATGQTVTADSLKFKFKAKGKAMSTHRMLGASTWDLTVIASISTAAIYVADIEEDYLSYMENTFSVSAFISDLNTACGCQIYSSITGVGYTITSDDGEDDGPNLNLLAILVLLIIPMAGVGVYLYRRQYSQVPKEDHTGTQMTGKAVSETGIVPSGNGTKQSI